MFVSRLIFFPFTLILTLLLLGCASPTPQEPTATPTATNPPSPTSTPEPTPEPEQSTNTRQLQNTPQFEQPEGQGGREFVVQTYTPPATWVDGSTPTESSMEYWLFLPDEYENEPDKNWPIILFLHGADFDGTPDFGFIGNWGLPETLINRAEPDDFPFIVLIPKLWPRTSWWIPEAQRFVMGMLEETEQEFRVDTDKKYISGYSMGGFGSWYLGTNFADQFAAVVSVAGSGYPAPPSDLRIMCNLDGKGILAIHGDEDNIVSYSSAENAVDLYRSTCSGIIEFATYEGFDHFDTPARAYRDPLLYDWLLQFSLDR